MVTDMTLVRSLLCSRTDTPPRGGPSLPKFRRLVSGNSPIPSTLATGETTPYVKSIRRAFLSSFTTAGLKQILPRQKQVIAKLLKQIEKRKMEETIDVQDLFFRAAADHIGKAGLDLDLGGLDHSNTLCDLITKCERHLGFVDVIPKYELQMLFPFLESTKEIKRDLDDLFEKWDEVADAILSREEPDPGDLSVWASLRRVRLPETNKPLSHDALRGELATAIIGGMDTTGHQLSWMFALLATHPHVVERVLDEFESQGFCGNNAKEVEFEDFAELPYLAAVVKEGMRRIHVAPFVSGRVLHKDMVIDGYRVPKGIPLGIPGGLIMNNESQWPDHLEFKPERWLEKKHSSETYYVPFSLGERSCVGERLAIQFMRLVVLYLVKNYRFEMKDKTVEMLLKDVRTSIVLEAKNGIYINFSSRT